MTSLLAARRQNLAAAHTLHPRAEAMRLGAAPSARLICPLWQSNPPSLPYSRKNRLVSNKLVYARLAHMVKKTRG
jgi:hypothetical protein